MASAACTCLIEQTGTAVSMTTEATTSISSSKYQITDTSKRVIDPDTAVSVIDNGSGVADADVTINFLHGIVTKVSGSFTGPVTITASYLPRYAVAEAKAFEIETSAEILDASVMATSTTAKTRVKGLADAKGTISQLDNLRTDLDSGGTTIVPFTDFTAGTRRVLSVAFPSGEIFRAFVRFENVKEGAEVASLLNSTLSWVATAAIGTDQTEGNAFAFGTDQ